MTTILDDARATEVDAEVRGDAVLVAAPDFAAATGWTLKPEGLCRGDVCIPLQGQDDVVVDGRVDAERVAPLLRRSVVVDAAAGVVAYAPSPAAVAEDLGDLHAPDVTLPQLDGTSFTLSEVGKKKKALVTWASWCGCRYDLPAWQALHAELEADGFTVISVALDEPEAAREFVEAVDPTFPVVIDRDHVVAERYGFVNVPTVIWIDEDDNIVRPPDIAPGDDMWRDFTGIDSTVHHDQLRAWVKDGTLPVDESTCADNQNVPTEQDQRARLHRRIAAHLHREGRDAQAQPHWEHAWELAPWDWAIQRGSMPLTGRDPFGQEFFDFSENWKQAGAPGYSWGNSALKRD
jgi:peroxiredoxin